MQSCTPTAVVEPGGYRDPFPLYIGAGVISVRASVLVRAPSPRDMSAPGCRTARIEIVGPTVERCSCAALPAEGNVKLRNYRVLNENLRVYTPTADMHTSPEKGKVVSRFGACVGSPSRQRILELVRPEDPGSEELEAIVQPMPRRGLARPLDDDARRFLQRTIPSPSPYLPDSTTPQLTAPRSLLHEEGSPIDSTVTCDPVTDREQSLAEELREAEQGGSRREVSHRDSTSGAAERERLGRLALAVEEDESALSGLGAAARRLDALLAESRLLHRELAAIQEDLQVQSVRACRCAAAARVLTAESLALRYLDDVVALLRGDVHAAVRARAWPFALGQRAPGRNYVV